MTGKSGQLRDWLFQKETPVIVYFTFLAAVDILDLSKASLVLLGVYSCSSEIKAPVFPNFLLNGGFQKFRINFLLGLQLFRQSRFEVCCNIFSKFN